MTNLGPSDLFATSHGHRQRGFTLIELICSMVIIGVLAATVMPRFYQFRSDAQLAVLNQLAANLASAAELGASKCRLKPGCNMADWSDAYVTDPTGHLGQLYNGYPTANTDAGSSPILNWVTTTGFDIDTSSIMYIDFKVIGARTPDSCRVRYNYASSFGAAPVLEVVSSDC